MIDAIRVLMVEAADIWEVCDVGDPEQAFRGVYIASIFNLERELSLIVGNLLMKARLDDHNRLSVLSHRINWRPNPFLVPRQFDSESEDGTEAVVECVRDDGCGPFHIVYPADPGLCCSRILGV